MKCFRALLPFLALLAGVKGAPTDAPDSSQANVVPAGVSVKDDKVPADTLPEGARETGLDSLTGYKSDPRSFEGGNGEDNDPGNQPSTSSNIAGDSTDTSAYSASLPSWVVDEYYENADSVNGADDSGNEVSLERLESKLISEKLEPLYQSISHLKSLLSQLREKASKDLQQLAESLPSNQEYSYEYSAGTSYISSAKQDEGQLLDLGDSDDVKHELDGQRESSNRSQTGVNKNKAIEAGMTDFRQQPRNGLTPGRRFKRDLGWSPRNMDTSDGPSLFDENETEASWSSSSAVESSVGGNEEDTLPLRILKLRQNLETESKPRVSWLDLLYDLSRQGYSPSEKFYRKRRYREDLRTFANSLPTLEGLRKRTDSTDDDSDNGVFVPSPGTPYPAPPNLPPPSNVIYPFLSPEGALPWEPPPDFEENNAKLEEQTNSIDMSNAYQKRVAYLKDIERSIIREPLQSLAVQLAGRDPVRPEMAMRVRRVMQIPPPPPYGRKVVKSLYRKKAFGFPFNDLDNKLLQDSWDASAEEDVSGPLDRYEIEDPVSFSQYLRRDQMADRRSHYLKEQLRRLFTYLATKEAEDQLLQRLLSSKDIPRVLQTSLAEADSASEADSDTESSAAFQSDDADNKQWGTFEDNESAGDVDLADFERKEEAGDAEWESSDSQGDAEFFSNGSESEGSIPLEWAFNTDEDIQTNILKVIDEMKQHILLRKLAEILERATEDET
ncbi:uncharacterized protein [Diadema setosum]|uniref:uncharacterized protein n=1 Tax=Diadema setosum TaxID=31175 RepID=UPI003B3A155D